MCNAYEIDNIEEAIFKTALIICKSKRGKNMFGQKDHQIMYSWVEFSSVAQLCPTLWEPMDCSTSGFLVHYQPLELGQTHVDWVADAIQPSHPLLSPSPPAFSLNQHKGFFPITQFFMSGCQRIGVSASASVLAMNIQDVFILGFTGRIFLLFKGLSRLFSNTTVQKRQFFSTQLSL